MNAFSRSPVQPFAAALAFVLAVSGAWIVAGGSAWAATDPAGTPFGNVDGAVGVPGGVQLRGWAIDPDRSEPIYVWVTIDGVGRHLYASQDRPDVGAAFPAFGPNHGFSATLPAAAGSHSVCVTASNVGAGVHKQLGCRTVTVLAGSPVGNFEGARGDAGAIDVAGWVIDPDTRDAIYVWVTIDGVGRHLYANRSRPDVGAAFPGYGPDHGFSARLAASPGLRTVCVTASNVGAGAHKSLGCRAVSVLAPGTPFGNFESAQGVAGGIEVRGWAIDPDTSDPIYVWVTVNGAGRHLYAAQDRPDVGAAYPAFGSGHGFQGTIPTPPGFYEVCVTASNVGAGAHQSLGCRFVQAGPWRVTDVISVGSRPEVVAYDPDGKTLYVGNQGDQTVSMIDTATNRVVATVGVGDAPWDMAVDTQRGELYVANDGGTLVVIDRATRRVVTTISTGSTHLSAVAVDPAAGEAYVIGGGGILVIDTATRRVVATISDVSGGDLAVNPPTRQVFVVDNRAQAVHVVDASTRRVVGSIPVGPSPRRIAVDSARSLAYVTNSADATVSIINIRTHDVVATVGTGVNARSGYEAFYVAFDPAANAVFVTLRADEGAGPSYVSRIDAATRRVTDLITTRTIVGGVAVDPTTHILYVTNSQHPDGKVFVVRAD